MAMTKPLSDQVRFTQDGTGATERLVSEKLKERVSVKDFGAVGDGVTDDTAAIQAAIDAATNELHFEDTKTYRISSALNVNKSNLRIIGRGATLNGSAQPASVSLSDRFALRVEGVWAGLVNCSNVAVSGNQLETSTSSRSAVYLDACVGVAVNGGTFRNTVAASGTSSGVYILGAPTDIAVTGINARSFNRGVYSVSPANFISVAGVNCRTCTTASVDVSASANTAVAGNL